MDLKGFHERKIFHPYNEEVTLVNVQIPEVTLNDGLRVPAIGFGTWLVRGAAGVQSMVSAIDMGYRLIDSAYNYENEGAVGEAIRRSSVPREKLIITSKLPGRYHEYDAAITAIQESLYRANLDYYDLYLIHWPNPKQNRYVEAWQALIDAKKWGLIRSIGVSNFLPEHIERLVKETGVVPSVNQIELHPYFNQAEQRKFHEKYNIRTQSWSPLYRGGKLFAEETIRTIAEKHGKTPAQVVLRWHYQIGAISIPKSQNPDRQFENLNIFDFVLDEGDMKAINALSEPEGRRKGQDPAEYEEF